VLYLLGMNAPASPSHVRVLPEAVANQIAAGEVVERPASVLKELVENSLDAGAGTVLVEVSGGGRRLVRVVDDGAGMTPDDLLLALERHATSKVLTTEDLGRVTTLGFRGEALPSIAAVSRFLLRSRPAGAETGSEVLVEGGVIKQVREVGCPPGTVAQVQDIFFNTPARRKFLKSQATEGGHLLATLTRLALARPLVAFRYRTGDKVLLDLPATQDLAVRAALLLGRETAGQMTRLEEGTGLLSLGGLAGLPSLSRNTYDQVYAFVNGRFVRDRIIMHAVAEAYRGLLPEGRRPVLVLHLEIDPALVDVNVHPAKTEVRFHRQQEVHDQLVEGLRRGLARSRTGVTAHSASSAQMLPPPLPRPAAPFARTAPDGPPRVCAPRPLPAESRPSWLGGVHPPYPSPEAEPPPLAPQARPLFTQAAELFVLGQLHGLYIICGSPEGLVIVDQHAAHERLTYESLKKALGQGTLASQGLLTPATLELTPQEALWAEAQAQDWRRLGLEMAPFGGNTWMVSAMPPVLSGRDPEVVVRDLLGELSAAGVSSQTPEFLEVALRSLACRASIKSGQHLSKDELTDLVARVAALPPPVTCPHGRPVFLTITRRELYRHFRRGTEPER